MKSIALAFAATLITTSSLHAQDIGEASVGLGFSNFGINLEAGYKINPSFRVRGALMGGVNFEYEETDIDGEVEGEFDLGGLALLGDYYPNQGGWRISGGLFFSNTELSTTGTSDIDALVDDTVTVDAEFANTIAPMITTGYDWAFADGWALNTEIGVIFNGGFDLDVKGTNAADQAVIDDDADVQEAKDDASDVSPLPYLGITVSYQF